MNEIAVKLKQLREEKQLSQLALGKLAGVNHSTISYIESGHRDFEQITTLTKLCKALDTSVVELLQSIEQNIDNK